LIILGIFFVIWISKGWRVHNSFFARPTNKSTEWLIRCVMFSDVNFPEKISR